MSSGLLSTTSTAHFQSSLRYDWYTRLDCFIHLNEWTWDWVVDETQGFRTYRAWSRRGVSTLRMPTEESCGGEGDKGDAVVISWATWPAGTFCIPSSTSPLWISRAQLLHSLPACSRGLPFIAFSAVSGGGSFQSQHAAAAFTNLAVENAVEVVVQFISLLSAAASEARNLSSYRKTACLPWLCRTNNWATRLWVWCCILLSPGKAMNPKLRDFCLSWFVHPVEAKTLLISPWSPSGISRDWMNQQRSNICNIISRKVRGKTGFADGSPIYSTRWIIRHWFIFLRAGKYESSCRRGGSSNAIEGEGWPKDSPMYHG